MLDSAGTGVCDPPIALYLRPVFFADWRSPDLASGVAGRWFSAPVGGLREIFLQLTAIPGVVIQLRP
jgi:hypothetical protein